MGYIRAISECGTLWTAMNQTDEDEWEGVEEPRVPRPKVWCSVKNPHRDTRECYYTPSSKIMEVKIISKNNWRTEIAQIWKIVLCLLKNSDRQSSVGIWKQSQSRKRKELKRNGTEFDLWQPRKWRAPDNKARHRQCLLLCRKEALLKVISKEN